MTHNVDGLEAICRNPQFEQWLAMAFVAGGAVLTTLGATPAPAAAPFSPGSVAIAVAVGAICYVAYGVDLPQSGRRLSRLR